MDIEQIKAEVKKLDDGLTEDEENYHAAVVMVASSVYGMNADNLAKLTGYPREQVRRFGRNARKSLLWQHDGVHANGWFDPELGGVAFWADALCMSGMLDRAPA